MASSLYLDYKRYRLAGIRPLSVLLFYQGFWASYNYRLSRWAHLNLRVPGVRQAAGFMARCSLKWTEIVTGISIPAACEIGGGLYIPHYGTIVVNSRARLGANCTIHQGVTIGTSGRRAANDSPVIGDRVYIGANAIIMGPVEIGDDAVIGAGAVVTKSVPPRGIAVGNPAVVKSRKGSFELVIYNGMETDRARDESLRLAQLESPAGNAADRGELPALIQNGEQGRVGLVADGCVDEHVTK